MMIGYNRTTRECSANQIHPSLYPAIREYFQTHQLGDLDMETLLCCETISEKRNPGKLASFLEGNPDSITHLAILLTAEWLIWARNGDRSGTIVTGAKLKVIQVNALVARRTKGMELEVSGFIAGSKEYVRGNLEMGPDVAAQKFCEVVGQAVLKANPPAKRKFPRWMGG
jgi:hypothetical protein